MAKTCIVYKDEQVWSLFTANDEIIAMNIVKLGPDKSYLIVDTPISLLDNAPPYDKTKVTQVA